MRFGNFYFAWRPSQYRQRTVFRHNLSIRLEGTRRSLHVVAYRKYTGASSASHDEGASNRALDRATECCNTDGRYKDSIACTLLTLGFAESAIILCNCPVKRDKSTWANR